MQPEARPPPMQQGRAPGRHPWERFSSSITANGEMEKWL
jgi:hypothetical protein